MVHVKTPAKKEGHLARKLRVARQIRDEPRSVPGLLRGWLLELWLARGGGFYGLGVVIAFVIFEIRFFVGDLWQSESLVNFVAQEVLSLVFRIGYQSIINLVLALIWPVYLLDRLGAWAIVLLIAGFLAFEKAFRPVLEQRLPELREARLKKARAKAEKAEAKRLKKARKNSR